MGIRQEPWGGTQWPSPPSPLWTVQSPGWALFLCALLVILAALRAHPVQHGVRTQRLMLCIYSVVRWRNSHASGSSHNGFQVPFSCFSIAVFVIFLWHFSFKHDDLATQKLTTGSYTYAHCMNLLREHRGDLSRVSPSSPTSLTDRRCLRSIGEKIASKNFTGPV